MQFETMHKKLNKELKERKKQISQTIELSNSAFEARDAALRRVAELKEKAQHEIQEFDKKLKELDQQILRDKQNRDLVQLMKGKSEKMRLEEQLKLRRVCVVHEHITVFAYMNCRDHKLLSMLDEIRQQPLKRCAPMNKHSNKFGNKRAFLILTNL